MTVRGPAFLPKANELYCHIKFLQLIVHKVYHTKTTDAEFTNKLKLAESDSIIIVVSKWVEEAVKVFQLSGVIVVVELNASNCK